jgi:hypothetical protein
MGLIDTQQWFGRGYRPMPSEWQRVDASTKALHMVGRTADNLQPDISDEAIEALRVEVGYDNLYVWKACTNSQRLDLLATRILGDDRMVETIRGQRRGLSAHAFKHVRYPTLSAHQALTRAKRELPVPNVQAIEDLNRIDRSPIKAVGRYWFTGDTGRSKRRR